MAGAQAIDAEGERISEDLGLAARERNWNSVERKYVKLVDEYPDVLTAPMHAAAAEAARTRGDLLRMAQRLARVPETDDTRAEIALLASNTGLVQLVAKPGQALEPAAYPFQPDLRAAIDRAKTSVDETGIFVGLLPAGDYTVEGEPLTVKPGFDWQVLLTR